MTNNFIEKKVRQEIERVLTPPMPRDADFHGGVNDWEHKYNKEGMKYMSDEIIDILRQALLSQLKEVERVVDSMKPVQDEQMSFRLGYHKCLSDIKEGLK